jgi:hypothetical protein
MFFNRLILRRVRHFRMLLAGIQAKFALTPDPFDVAQGRGEHSRTTIKTFGGDGLGSRISSAQPQFFEGATKDTKGFVVRLAQRQSRRVMEGCRQVVAQGHLGCRIQCTDNFLRGFLAGAHAIGDPDAVVSAAGESQRGKWA